MKTIYLHPREASAFRLRVERQPGFIRFLCLSLCWCLGLIGLAAQASADPGDPPHVFAGAPAAGSIIKDFALIDGVAYDYSGTGLQGNVVDFNLYNVSTSQYWDGTGGWSNSAVTLIASWDPNAADGNYWVWGGKMPSASDGTLRQGLYTLSASATDNTGKKSDSTSDNQIQFTVDNTPPTLKITSPANNANVSSLSSVTGTITDPNSTGGSVVVTLHRLGDNTYWNGSQWVASSGSNPTLNTGYASGSTWSYTGALPSTGPSSSTNLTKGSYELTAIGTDKAGNQTTTVNRFDEDFSYVWTGATLHDQDPNNDDNRWSVAKNWSPNGVPGSGDKVVIDNGDAVDLDGDHVVAALSLGAGSINNYHILVTGAGSDFSGGTMNGTTFTVAATATMTIDTVDNPSLSSGSIDNAGTLTFSTSGTSSPGVMYIFDSTITNEGSSVIQLARDGTLFSYQGGTVSIVNSGAVTKTAGTGTTGFGSVSLQNQTGGSFGAATGTLSLDSGLTVVDDNKITGPGTVLLTSAASISGKVTVTGILRFQSSITFNAATLVQGSGGALDWDTGSFTGTLSLPAGTTLAVDTAGNPSFNGFTLNNAGTISVATTGTSAGGNVGVMYIFDSTINNQSGGLFQIVRDGQITSYQGGTTLIKNASGARLLKKTGTGRAVFDWAVENDGTVEVDTGTLALNGGSAGQSGSGVYNSAAGAHVEFVGGTHLLAAGASFSGAGTALLTGGEVTCTGAVSVGTASAAAGGLVQSGGTLDGTGSFNVFSGAACAWSAGTVSTTYSFKAGASLAIDTVGNPSFNGATFNNAGTISVATTGTSAGGNVGVMYIFDSTINNQSGGLFQIVRDGQITSYQGGTTFISNQSGSRLLKKGTSGRAVFDWAVANSGTVEADNGTLALNGGSNGVAGSGVYNSAAGAHVEFVGGTHLLAAGASFSGAGTALLTGGEVTCTGAVSVGTASAAAGGLVQSGGTLDGTGSFNVFSGAACAWSAGTVSTTYSFKAGASLAIDTVGGPSFNTATLNNAGTITVATSGTSAAGTLGTTNIFNSTINNQSGGLLRLSRDGSIFTYQGGTVGIVNTGTITRTTGTGTTDLNIGLDERGTLSAASGTLSVSGDTTVNAASHVSGAGIVSNANITLKSALYVAAGGTFEFGAASGTLTSTLDSNNKPLGAIYGPGTFLLTGGTVTGTLNLGATLATTLNTAHALQFSNLTLNNYGTMTVTGGTNPLQGTSTTFNNLLGATLVLQSNVFLQNTGTTPSFVNAGTVELGTTKPIIATTDWAISQKSTGVLEFYLAGANASTPQFSQLKVSNTVSLDGTIGGILASGYKPLNKIAYTVLTFTSHTGDFDKVIYPNAPAGTTLTKVTEATDVKLVTALTPTITSPLTATGNDGQPFTYQITANNSPTSFDAMLLLNNGKTASLPADLRVDVKSGLISGTPKTAGTFNIQISATNAVGTTTATLVLTINEVKPTVTKPDAAKLVLTVGVKYSYQVVATNNPTGYTAPGLPPGLTIDPTKGIISGTPTQVGTFPVTITATNRAGSGSVSVTFTVNPPAPVVTSATITGNVGVAIKPYQIVASNNPTSYTVTGLKDGLAFNASTHTITGTPTKAETYTVTVTATNAGGTGKGTLTITIKAAPVFAQTQYAVTSPQGQAFSYQITASNTPTSYNAVRVLANGNTAPLPDGLIVNKTNGKITGTLRTVGTYTIRLTAANSDGTATATLILTVKASAPVFAQTQYAVTSPQGQAFSYQITASNTPTSYNAVRVLANGNTAPLPDGLIVNKTNGKIMGTLRTVGTYTIRLTATNSAGSGTATLTLTINKAATPADPGQDDLAKTGTGAKPSAAAKSSGTLAVHQSQTTTGAVNPQNDDAVTTDTPAALLVVSASAVEPRTTAEGAGIGVITLSVPEALPKDLVVSYKVAGSAVNGIDYKYLRGTQTIRAGRTTATIKIIPRMMALDGTVGKLVQITLTPGAEYEVGTSAPAEVEIAPGK